MKGVDEPGKGSAVVDPRAAAHRYKSASTVRPEGRRISRSLRSMTAKGPRDLNCATSGLRDSRYRWSSAGFAAFIGVTSVAGNRRAQPTECAMRAISRRARSEEHTSELQ